MLAFPGINRKLSQQARCVISQQQLLLYVLNVSHDDDDVRSSRSSSSVTIVNQYEFVYTIILIELTM